ncbi:MAG: hypothetical protein C4B56_07240 [Candidatus Methanophagaceae archaeon]|nr:MAG: hypothetical protein C4B56_07240 [Methanophagales archaeon]
MQVSEVNKIDGSSGLTALVVLLLLFTFTYTEVAVTALPVTILVQPEEGSINASVVVSAVVTTRRDWTFNINWSYRVNASSENPMPFELAVNRSATLKIIQDNTNANTLTAFAMDAEGDTANATVTLCTNTSPKRIKIRTNMSALRLLLPDLKINNEKDNEKVVQFEMSVINESTQDITELLKKYRNGNASLSLLADHDVRIKVNASDIIRLIAGSDNTVHGSITFIEDTVPFELVSQRDTDTILPVLTVASPQEDQMLASHNVTLAVSANEPIARWYYRLNNDNGTNVSFVPPAVINASEGANQLLISATDLAGNRGYAVVNFSVDTIPPVLTVASPQEDQKLASHNVTLAVSANEPIARWYYRLNNGTNVSFASPNGDEHTKTTLIAKKGENKLDVYADDLAGNTGKATIFFVVMEPRIATESSIQGTGSIAIEKEMSSSTAGIESEEQIVGTTGTGGNYLIISIEILSKPVNITNQNYPDYHHAEVISFTGNDLIITHEHSALDTQSGVNVTFTEDINVVKLQKQNTVDIKTTYDNPSISYNTRATDVFIGNKQTKVDLSTPTKKVSIHHSLEGNCTSRMRLTFEE